MSGWAVVFVHRKKYSMVGITALMDNCLVNDNSTEEGSLAGLLVVVKTEQLISSHMLQFGNLV